MKFIIYIFLASLIEPVNWCSRFFVMLAKGMSYLFNTITRILQKGQRPLFALSIREQRKLAGKKDKKPVIKEVLTKKGKSQPIVGSTKTVFIFELPVLNDPVPLETIELPLEDPQEPVEIPFPEPDEFEQEIQTISEDELRKEMEESIYDGYEGSLPDDDDNAGGVSIQEIERAYMVLNNPIHTEAVSNDVVANVIYTLNGTDMFKMFINTEESDKKAKVILDNYINKFMNPVQTEKSKGFNMDNYLE